MKKRYIILLAVILLIAAYTIYYINDYYHADSEALNSLNNSTNVTVLKTSNGYLFDGAGNDTALIFYPGAKVEYTSYAPLMNHLAKRGIDTYLVEMPFNLAIFGQNSADDIIKSSNYSHYVLSGHSFGGVMASKYVHEHNVDGLVLLAAYPTDKINTSVLSIYGENDKVLNTEKYNDSKHLMSNLTEYVIPGANHGQFANYGNQSGDGEASISSAVQQNMTVSYIVDFIEKLF